MSVSKNLTSVGVFTDFLQFRHKHKPHFSQSTGPNVLATRDSEICDGEALLSTDGLLVATPFPFEFDRSSALQSERGEGEKRSIGSQGFTSQPPFCRLMSIGL